MKPERGVIVIPTFNEAENLEALVTAIWKHVPGADILVVDDNSPDGTGELADRLSRLYPDRFFVLHRKAKDGLGRAYVHAFLTLLNSNYEYLVQMDADFSHDPAHLSLLIAGLADHDLVLGSRYLHGISVVNWDFKRLMLSKFATAYVRLVTGLPVTDSTGGYKAWRLSALRSLDLQRVFSQGYLFQVEMTWRAYQQGLRVGEAPIVFHERRLGQSKIDLRVITEAATGVLRLRWKSKLVRSPRPDSSLETAR